MFQTTALYNLGIKSEQNGNTIFVYQNISIQILVSLKIF